MKERPHGFRSSFRDWCAEATDTPREVAKQRWLTSTAARWSVPIAAQIIWSAG